MAFADDDLSVVPDLRFQSITAWMESGVQQGLLVLAGASSK
jgi:hypothetical protein